VLNRAQVTFSYCIVRFLGDISAQANVLGLPRDDAARDEYVIEINLHGNPKEGKSMALTVLLEDQSWTWRRPQCLTVPTRAASVVSRRS
jgi:hypothetical protein